MNYIHDRLLFYSSRLEILFYADTVAFDLNVFSKKPSNVITETYCISLNYKKNGFLLQKRLDADSCIHCILGVCATSFVYLGDNCMQNFHLWWYIVGFMVGNFGLR